MLRVLVLSLLFLSVVVSQRTCTILKYGNGESEELFLVGGAIAADGDTDFTLGFDTSDTGDIQLFGPDARQVQIRLNQDAPSVVAIAGGVISTALAVDNCLTYTILGETSSTVTVLSSINQYSTADPAFQFETTVGELSPFTICRRTCADECLVYVVADNLDPSPGNAIVPLDADCANAPTQEQCFSDCASCATGQVGIEFSCNTNDGAIGNCPIKPLVPYEALFCTDDCRIVPFTLYSGEQEFECEEADGTGIGESICTNIKRETWYTISRSSWNVPQPCDCTTSITTDPFVACCPDISTTEENFYDFPATAPGGSEVCEIPFNLIGTCPSGIIKEDFDPAKDPKYVPLAKPFKIVPQKPEL